MHVAQAKQGDNIRLMRLCHERITQEYDQIHLVLGDHRSDLLVTPKWPGQETVHLQPGFLDDAGSCRACGIQIVLSEYMLVGRDEIDHLVLFSVVGYQRDIQNKETLLSFPNSFSNSSDAIIHPLSRSDA